MMRTIHSKCKMRELLLFHVALVRKSFVDADNVESYERKRASYAYSPVDDILPASKLPREESKRRVDVVMF